MTQQAQEADFGGARRICGCVHLLFLMDFRGRVAVAINWFWSYVTYQQGARLITGALEE